ncbi:hypothetical protein VTN02DRAFT_6338 [Thermoascus thermophilus]
MDQTIYRLKTHWSAACHRLEDNDQNGPSRWLRRTTALRFVTAHLALVGFALFAAAIQPWEENFVHTKGPARGDWQDGVPIAPLALSFTSNILHTIHVLWRAKPVPALASGIVDLLVWALLIPGIVFAAWGGAFRLWRRPVVEQPGGAVLCDVAQNVFSRACYPELYRIGGLELGGIVCGVLVWTVTTFLFVHGCIEASNGAAANDRTGFDDLERGRARAWNGRQTTKDSISRPQMARMPPMGMPR